MMRGAVSILRVPNHVTNNDFDYWRVDQTDLLNVSTSEVGMERLLHRQ